MYILLLLLCAATASSLNIPPINGKDHSGFFNFMKQEFETRRMHINIVDTVHSDSASSEQSSPSTVSIGLQPSDSEPEDYGFLSRKISEQLRCMDATNAAFTSNSDAPEYVLAVNHNNTLAIYRDEDHSAEGEEMVRRIALQAGMTKEEADIVELIDCWFMRSPEVMRINIALGEEPRIKSGWIVERYPLGRFYQNPSTNYRYPIYITNHSYIDGSSNTIVDVHESKDANGKRVWTPSSWSAFARLVTEQVEVKDLTDYTLFRETETGVLITTLCPNMTLSYNINTDAYEERIRLDGHHYHVSCDRKQGTRYKIMEIRGYPHYTNDTTNDGMTITLSSLNRTHRFRCEAKRATPTGIPELLQLDFVEQSGSIAIPFSSDRNLTITAIDVVLEADEENEQAKYEALRKAYNKRREDAATSDEEEIVEARELPYSHEQTPLVRKPKIDEAYIQEIPHNDALREWYEQAKRAKNDKIHDDDLLKAMQAEEEERRFIELLLTLLAVAILALITVIIVLACARHYIRKSRKSLDQESSSTKKGEERRRKDGGCKVPVQSTDATDKQFEEEQDEEKEPVPKLTPMPTRSNSGKKKISFAPCKPTMRTDDLAKMISDAEIGSRIDAMIDAGPDGEEVEPQEPQQPSAASSAPMARSEVVDETSEPSDASETSSADTDQTLLID